MHLMITYCISLKLKYLYLETRKDQKFLIGTLKRYNFKEKEVIDIKNKDIKYIKCLDKSKIFSPLFPFKKT